MKHIELFSEFKRDFVVSKYRNKITLLRKQLEEAKKPCQEDVDRAFAERCFFGLLWKHSSKSELWHSFRYAGHYDVSGSRIHWFHMTENPEEIYKLETLLNILEQVEGETVFLGSKEILLLKQVTVSIEF